MTITYTEIPFNEYRNLPENERPYHYQIEVTDDDGNVFLFGNNVTAFRRKNFLNASLANGAFYYNNGNRDSRLMFNQAWGSGDHAQVSKDISAINRAIRVVTHEPVHFNGRVTTIEVK